MPVPAAGTADVVHLDMTSGAVAGALDMTLISAAFKGSITGSVKIADMAALFGMRARGRARVHTLCI